VTMMSSCISKFHKCSHEAGLRRFSPERRHEEHTNSGKSATEREPRGRTYNSHGTAALQSQSPQLISLKHGACDALKAVCNLEMDRRMQAEEM
jgi:hypothetical protein